ncbi:stromal cell-derived factor 2 [Histomonas meleagridis]|uniref:stromal cell-derived factor 2 n=1 Tax=Histomonas meleagridis TaxID=135588 RepID=UPI0035596AFA|nr:stromal cell-derived factor 2 [Histomonas meleagridis]KAH0804775.1 stromal cell-derived factor 2 [Histomonas meleagridis]
MLLFSLLIKYQMEQPVVRYSSVIQLQSVYSGNKLSTTTESDSLEIPSIYCTRLPFDNGWLWVVDDVVDPIENSRKPIECGSNITLINPITKSYVGTKKSHDGIEVVPTTLGDDPENQWTVICSKGPNWVKDDEVQLQNVKNSCYLSTSLELRQDDLSIKYNVTCSPLSSASVWKSAEGVYILEEEEQKETPREEL